MPDETKMLIMFNLADGIYWRPHIGDPTLLGWTTVYAYFCAALLSLTCALGARQIFNDQYTHLHRSIWSGLALGLFALGLNKQLDLQTLFTDAVKHVAYEQGWYEQGQSLQVFFIASVVGIGGLGLLIVAWLVRRVWKQYWLLLFGGAALGRFVVVRAATFYGVTLPELSRFTGGLRINWLLELVAVCIIMLAALMNIVHYRRS